MLRYTSLVVSSLTRFLSLYRSCLLVNCNNPWKMLPGMPVQKTLVRNKHTVDYSRVPKLSEDDLEEKFVRGSGPGGSAVNKNSNCVVLTHVPTGIVVKCHLSRSQDENRKLARESLVSKLDDLMNGAASVKSQLKAMQDHKSIEQSKRSNKLRDMKTKWKEREGLNSNKQD